MYLLPVLPLLPEPGLIKGKLVPHCTSCIPHCTSSIPHCTCCIPHQIPYPTLPIHLYPKEMGYFFSAGLLTLQGQEDRDRQGWEQYSSACSILTFISFFSRVD